MKLPPPHRRSSIRRRQTYIDIHNSLVDHAESAAPMTYNTCAPYRHNNSPQNQFQKASNEDGEPYKEYSTQLEEITQQQEYYPRKRQLPPAIELQPKSKRYRRFLCLPQRCITVKSTHSLSFVEDQGCHFIDNNYHTPISGVSSCISSLSADESDYYVLNLAPAVHNNTQSPYFEEDQDNRYDDNNIGSRPLDAASISSLSDDESYGVLNQATVVQNIPPVRTMNSDSHDHLRIDSEIHQTGTEDLGQGFIRPHRTFNVNTSRPQTSFPLCYHRTISTSTVPTITLIPSHSRIQHSGNGSFTIRNDTHSTSCDQSKKIMSQHDSFSRILLPAIVKPASISEELRSKSEPVYIANTSFEFSKYDTYHSFPTTRRKKVRRVVKYVLTGMMAVLIKKKSYDFERSSGSLT